MLEPTNPRNAKPGYEDEGVGGWIAPDGTFFQAEYYEHYDMAVEIIKRYLNTSYFGSPSDYLEDRGWIRLETAGTINHDHKPTSSQLDVLYMLYTRGGTEYYNTRMYRHIKPVLETNRVREAMPRVPSQGDQENVRRLYA